MSDHAFTITFTSRDVARLVLQAAPSALRELGLLWSPRAWLYVFRACIRLWFGGST